MSLNCEYTLNLHDILKSHSLDAVIVPSWDEWANEMPQNKYQRLQKLCNFTGSNGLAIIGANSDTDSNNCAFFTDGRYTLQAKQQLPSNYTILDFNCEQILKFLKEFYHDKRIGFDPYVIHYKHTESFLQNNCGAIFIPVEGLVPAIDSSDSNMNLLRNIEALPDDVISTTFDQKKDQLFNKLKGYDYIFITSPDTIAWLLNCRVIDDIAKNQTYSFGLNAYLLLKRDNLDIIYVDDQYKFPNNFKIEIRQLHQASIDIKNVPVDKLYISKNTPYVFSGSISEDNLQKFDITSHYKCLKTDLEIEQIKKINIKDSIILTKFIQDLHKRVEHLDGNLDSMDEYTLGKNLTAARALDDNFICNSFNPIVGSGSNGAIIHYRADEHSCKKIDMNQLLLIDSGGHYRWGTTDVTRTIRVNRDLNSVLQVRPQVEINKEQILFTKVLQGLINVFLFEFNNATGAEIDAIARKPLNDIGYDYPHSTGHGVGFVISVHEGPIRLSKAYTGDITPGMVLSVEPGVYIEGEFGIRIENLAVVKVSLDGKRYFEPITFVPIQTDLVEMEILTAEQLKWLNDYNLQCVELFNSNL